MPYVFFLFAKFSRPYVYSSPYIYSGFYSMTANLAFKKMPNSRPDPLSRTWKKQQIELSFVIFPTFKTDTPSMVFTLANTSTLVLVVVVVLA